MQPTHAWIAGAKSVIGVYDEEYWSSLPPIADLLPQYPVMLVVHTGYRPASSPDVSLHNITLTSFVYSFLIQWQSLPTVQRELLKNQSIVVYFSLDVQSFEGRTDKLDLQLQNLRHLILSFADQIPFLSFRFMFGSGLASTYHRVLAQCDDLSWCRYVILLEEDWLFEHSNIHISLWDLVQVLDENMFMNYVRFSQFFNNFTHNNWDAPCLVRDVRIQGNTAFLKGAGFSNNPHICRAAAMRKVYDVVYDYNQLGSEGVEHDYFHRASSAASLYALCSSLSYDCRTQIPFHSNTSVCNTDVWKDRDVFVRQEQWIAEFTRDATECHDDSGYSPNYDHCGLYVLGDWNDLPRVSHLNGKVFTPTGFWGNPISYMTQERLPYYT